MAVTVNKEVMNTEWYFQTPVYSIMKPDWLKSAIKATDKFIVKPTIINYLNQSGENNFMIIAP